MKTNAPARLRHTFVLGILGFLPALPASAADKQWTDLFNGRTLKGIIGLQVHSIGKSKKAPGEEVRWRNWRIKELAKTTP